MWKIQSQETMGIETIGWEYNHVIKAWNIISHVSQDCHKDWRWVLSGQIRIGLKSKYT